MQVFLGKAALLYHVEITGESVLLQLTVYMYLGIIDQPVHVIHVDLYNSRAIVCTCKPV